MIIEIMSQKGNWVVRVHVANDITALPNWETTVSSPRSTWTQQAMDLDTCRRGITTKTKVIRHADATCKHWGVRGDG